MVTEDFYAAKAHADEIGWIVCGTYKTDGTPVYTVQPPEIDEDAVHDESFRLRHGREISDYERWGIEVAKRLAAGEEPELSLT